ncbi:MAG: DNA/RNA non-specific endonuclease, partial [Pseudomonadota bacterium]|nr:DNA/RNA non-specific endonuclease [Pseudomonadota bacterium]
MTSRQLINLLHPLFSLIAKNPKYLIGVVLAGGLWFAYEMMVARPAMSYMGVPKIIAEPAIGNWNHILRSDGFMLEYSEKRQNPLWVTYQVTEKKQSSGKRPSGFKQDWRSFASVSHQDYTGSGYDRGHMAPNYVIASRYGRSAQLDTFVMTNITPQKPNLNQKSWQRLEEVIANDFSEWHGDFWVVTGPIFGENPKTLKNSDVQIPKAFYKILIKPSTQEMPAKALAFIFPQNAKAK